jgi:hypothetical protein
VAAIHARLAVMVTATRYRTSTLSEMSPLDDWLRDQTARVPTMGLLRELAPIIGGAFGKAADDPDELDPHFHSYFGTMSIRGVLEFAAPVGGPDPDVRMAELSGAVDALTTSRPDSRGVSLGSPTQHVRPSVKRIP